MRGDPTKVMAIPEAYDSEVGSRLWEVSEELTGVSYGLPVAASRLAGGLEARRKPQHDRALASRADLDEVRASRLTSHRPLLSSCPDWPMRPTSGSSAAPLSCIWQCMMRRIRQTRRDPLPPRRRTPWSPTSRGGPEVGGRRGRRPERLPISETNRRHR